MQKATGAFMQLNAAQDSKLVAASSPMMALEGGAMKMRPVTAIPLPAGKTVELRPGGHHVMLMDLKQQVKAGDTVALTLVFEGRDVKREQLDVAARVRALGTDAATKSSSH